VLIHENYLSQKDIDFCLAFDLVGLADRPEIDYLRTLHEILRAKYGSGDEWGAASPPNADRAAAVPSTKQPIHGPVRLIVGLRTQ
jgi:hypothetical protein